MATTTLQLPSPEKDDSTLLLLTGSVWLWNIPIIRLSPLCSCSPATQASSSSSAYRWQNTRPTIFTVRQYIINGDMFKPFSLTSITIQTRQSRESVATCLRPSLMLVLLGLTVMRVAESKCKRFFTIALPLIANQLMQSMPTQVYLKHINETHQ